MFRASQEKQYNKIKDLYSKCEKHYEIVKNLEISLNSKFENCKEDEQYEDISSSLTEIYKRTIDNKLYKELINGPLEEQIELLKKTVIAHDNYDVKTYNITIGLKPYLDDKGNQVILSAKKFNKLNGNKFKASNLNEATYPFKIYLFENSNPDITKEIKKLKSLELMLDEQKLNDIINDINNSFKKLEDLEADYILLAKKLETPLSEDDESLEVIEEYAQYLP